MDFARADAVEALLHLNVYRHLQETGVCGATVCLTKVGRYAFSLTNCYGFHDASRGTLLDAGTSMFDLGGCAKVLAALALLRILQARGLTVAAEVKALLPPGLQIDTSRYGGVTLQHLLTHTSGLQRGAPDRPVQGPGPGPGPGPGAGSRPSSSEAGRGAEGPEKEALSPSPAATLRPRPGSGPATGASDSPAAASGEAARSSRSESRIWSYLTAHEIFGAKPPGVYRPQDVDYMLLGAIIEHLTGEPYDSHVKAVFLTPLGVRLPEPPQPQQQQQAQAVAGDGCDAAAASGRQVEADDTPSSAAVCVYMQPQAAAHQLQAPGTAEWDGSAAGGKGAEAAAALIDTGPAASTGCQRVRVRYDPPPLTPVGGLVLAPKDIAKLLALLVPGRGGEEETAGQAQAQVQGLTRSLLSSLCSIQLSDFVKDVGVAYGGLVSLGLAHCGDAVVTCESPPPLPSTREQILAAAQQAQPQPGAQDAAQQQPQPSAAVSPEGLAGGGEVGGRGGSGSGGGGGGDEPVAAAGHPSLLLLAPESGFAMLVSCNSAGPEGTAFCRKVASSLLEAFRPSEMARSTVRSWLTWVPPPRQDAIMHLVVFPPACCTAPVAYFDGWPLLMPDYIKIHCVQAPGHGSRRGETCELRLHKLVPAATAAIMAGVPGDAPLALFGHGLGALWAYEVARRLEGVYQRQVLHLLVSACASPFCFGPRSAQPVAVAVETTGGGSGGEGAPRSTQTKRFEPWRIPDQDANGETAAAGALELYELPDDAFIAACRRHPRCPRQLRANTKSILEHLSLLRADIEIEMKYTFQPPAPAMCASVAAALATVQNRSDEEARMSQGLLTCPVMVLIPEEDSALGREQTAGWEQVTTGQVRFQAVPGDYHCLEDRRHRAQMVAIITNAIGRQLSVHVSWLAKLRPAGSGGRWAGSGRPNAGSRPNSAAGGPGPPGLTLHVLPPVYPRG